MDVTLLWPPALALAAIGLIFVALASILHLRGTRRLCAQIAALETSHAVLRADAARLFLRCEVLQDRLATLIRSAADQRPLVPPEPPSEVAGSAI